MKMKFEIQKLVSCMVLIPTLSFISFNVWSSEIEKPKSIKDFVKSEVMNIQGTFEIVMVTPAKQNTKEAIKYLLKTKEGDVYQLYFNTDVKFKFATGDILKIKKAYLLKNTVNLNQLLVNVQDVTLLEKFLPPASKDSLIPQKTLIILANYRDKPDDKPMTPQQAYDLIFGANSGQLSVNNQYKEASYNQTSIIGKVSGWYTLPLDSTGGCEGFFYNGTSLANNAATAAGENLFDYIRIIYFFPKDESCSWAGQGNYGRGKGPAGVWINGYMESQVFIHEIGHNLILDHSNLLDCGDEVNTGPNCKQYQYGDTACSMGNSFDPSHFNAIQKENLGWLDYDKSPPMQTITTSGTYVIYPYELNNKDVKALKILR